MTKQLQIVAVFIIVSLSYGYLLYPSIIYSLTDTTHWLVVLSQGFIQLILVWLYIKGLKRFPQHTLLDIYSKMGKWMTLLFLFPFALNLIALITFSVRMHTETILSIFLPRTPYWSILLLLLFISAYTAIKGFDTILRSAIFIVLLILFIILLNTFSSFVNYDVYNIASDKHVSIAFLLNPKFLTLIGFSSFLFLGFITNDKPLTFPPFMIASIGVIVILLSFIYMPLLIFGHETVVTMTHPLLEATDSINIGWFVFNRQTMFLGITLIGFVILASAVMLWMIGQIMQSLLPKSKRKNSFWIIIFTTFSLIAALLLPNQAVAEKYFLWGVGIQAFFMAIIPLTIFIYGFASKRGGVKHEN